MATPKYPTLRNWAYAIFELPRCTISQVARLLGMGGRKLIPASIGGLAGLAVRLPAVMCTYAQLPTGQWSYQYSVDVSDLGKSGLDMSADHRGQDRRAKVKASLGSWAENSNGHYSFRSPGPKQRQKGSDRGRVAVEMGQARALSRTVSESA